MELSEHIKEITGGLNEAIESIKLDAEAERMAHNVLDQFQSLTYDAWVEGGMGEPNLDQLEKIISQDMKVILYGKMLHHAQDHISESVGIARKSWRVKLNWWNPRIRRNAKAANEAFQLGITYLALKKIKLDIIRQYEEEKDKK